MLRKAFSVATAAVIGITSMTAMADRRGGGGHERHEPRPPMPGPMPGPDRHHDHRWCGWGPGGKALFWTSFGIEVGALVVGTMVTYLPPGHTVVYVNGTPYYYYDNTYYAVVPGTGYMVVNPPQQVVIQQPAPQVVIQQTPAPVVVQQTPAPAATPSAATTQSPAQAPAAAGTANSGSSDKYDVYLPNGNGTFTVVPLTKTAKGFMGPQGEFYEDHPTVEQLKERYLSK